MTRRSRIPVTADMAPDELRAGARRRRALDVLDVVFVPGARAECALRAATQRVAVHALPYSAPPPVAPSRQTHARFARATSRVELGSMVVGLPWRENPGAWRSFRDGVMPLLDTRPVYVIAGVPARRIGGLRRELDGGRHRVAFVAGALDADVLSALARYADALLLPWTAQQSAPGSHELLCLASAAAGAPVIAIDEPGQVLQHEADAFLVRAGDGAGFRSTLDQLLQLPPRQRHFIGVDFAASVMARWPLAPVHAVYAERFAALAGIPQIPLELRAA